MKAPLGLDQLSLTGDITAGPYPPSGFAPVFDAELGNGDYFGLYWPIGWENREPLVCDMAHDCWTMIPCFPTSSAFVTWLEENDHERGDLPWSDPEFAPASYEQGKAHVASGGIAEAIVAFERACAIFPEAADFWFALAGQLRRSGNHAAAVIAALRAYTANWTFGRPADGVLRLIQLGENIPALANDPLVKRGSQLTNRFGGEKDNANYALLRAAVAEYLDRGESRTALLLEQNVALMLSTETVSFQERSGFILQEWRTGFARLCAEHLGDARDSIH
jgi:tetratricopeptide (TPR) repeat protein